MPVRIGINGFGRMGRALRRAARRPELVLEVVAVNVLGSPEALFRHNEWGYANRWAELSALAAAASRP
jgi:glyceraldehyde-3-phosphate dehydrogenase/erythrose-4-phosphate dehydrogenase